MGLYTSELTNSDKDIIFTGIDTEGEIYAF